MARRGLAAQPATLLLPTGEGSGTLRRERRASPWTIAPPSTRESHRGRASRLRWSHSLARGHARVRGLGTSSASAANVAPRRSELALGTLGTEHVYARTLVPIDIDPEEGSPAFCVVRGDLPAFLAYKHFSPVSLRGLPDRLERETGAANALSGTGREM